MDSLCQPANSHYSIHIFHAHQFIGAISQLLIFILETVLKCIGIRWESSIFGLPAAEVVEGRTLRQLFLSLRTIEVSPSL
jgi:hypothetical protein